MEWDEILQDEILVARYKDLIAKNCNIQGDCWIWQKSLDKDGYGETSISRHRRKRWAAYKVAFILYKGMVANGLQIRHTCNNKRCCNPDHLVLGTMSDNMQDRQYNNNGIDDRNFKLNREAVLDIYHLRYDLGYTNKQLCEAYGVAESTIRNIYLGKSWQKVFMEYWNLSSIHEINHKRTELLGGGY